MDHWNTLPAWGWMFVALAFGYAIGLIHAFYKTWFKGKIYCPRCTYYLNWRDTVLREIIPEWLQKKHQKDPWERENPPGLPNNR
jgi:hypothetical protein